MNIFKQLCRTLVLSAVAVALSVGVMGCPPTDPPDDDIGTFTDNRDGQRYKTVKIGRQTWMAENLNYVMDSSWCYDYDNAKCAAYGRLYAWDAAMTACPTGWRLPDMTDWTELVETVGESWSGKLKSTSGWNENKNGTDNYGFTALPSGWLNYRGSFVDNGSNTFWWTSDEVTNGTRAYRHGIVTHTYSIDDSSPKIEGFSVRCVKNN